MDIAIAPANVIVGGGAAVVKFVGGSEAGTFSDSRRSIAEIPVWKNGTAPLVTAPVGARAVSGEFCREKFTKALGFRQLVETLLMKGTRNTV